MGWGGSSQHPFVGLLEVSALLLCLPSRSSVAPVEHALVGTRGPSAAPFPPLLLC